jgi:hypothetical protein
MAVASSRSCSLYAIRSTAWSAPVLVLERLQHFAREEDLAVAIRLPAIEYRLTCRIVVHIGKSVGKRISG